jgi:hypothetical protein
VIIGPYDLGAYAETWTPSGVQAELSMVGSGRVTRGGVGSIEPFSLLCNAFGSACGDGYRSYQTCDVAWNKVEGSTRHSAIFAATQWYGTFSDSIRCAGPTHTASCGAGDDGKALMVDDPGYDPYSDPESCTGGGGSGQTDDASGVQYYPGDYTGGETVSWATGTGDGGSSVCGAAAMVDYICIDVYDEGSGSWREWGCGYATTC